MENPEVKPGDGAEYTTPDGVRRMLRFTLGARKRIALRFKEPNLGKIMVEIGAGALPEVAYCMMYDENQNPPENLSLANFEERLGDEDPLFIAIMTAIKRSEAPTQLKKLAEALLQAARDSDERIGSAFGALRGNVSAYPTESSGISPNGNSSPSPDNTESRNEPSTAASV